MTLARTWAPIGGFATFDHGTDGQRQVVRYAAAERDIVIDDVAPPKLFWLRHGERRVLFYNYLPDTTTFVAREISNSKQLTKRMLSVAGVPNPEGESFSRGDRARAWAYARKLGLPVVVKSQSGSGGVGVTPGIADEAHFRTAWDDAGRTATVVVEKHVAGIDNRILVVGDKAVCATLREPAFVVGDGRATIAGLIEARNLARAENRFVGRKPLKISPMIERNLAILGLTTQSVIEAGRRLRLHEIANVGGGGDSEDVTDRLHPDFAEIAVRAARAIPGIAHAGVDLLAPDISRPAAGQRYAVCEINTRPDIALHHFPFFGPARDAAGAMLDHFFPEAAIVPRERWRAVSLRLAGNGGPPDLRAIAQRLAGKATGREQAEELRRLAALSALTGWVRSGWGGALEAYFCGPPLALERLVRQLDAKAGRLVESRAAEDQGLEAVEIG